MLGSQFRVGDQLTDSGYPYATIESVRRVESSGWTFIDYRDHRTGTNGTVGRGTSIDHVDIVRPIVKALLDPEALSRRYDRLQRSDLANASDGRFFAVAMAMVRVRVARDAAFADQDDRDMSQDPGTPGPGALPHG